MLSKSMGKTQAQTTARTKLKTKPKAGPIDRLVGANIKRLRQKAVLTQQQAAKALGISFQQLQKYEQGLNRTNAAILFHLSQLLHVPVHGFYEGAETLSLNETESAPQPTPEEAKLVAAWREIENPDVRAKLLGLVRAVAKLD